jgi:PAS domain S-box-containing protein
VRNPLLVLRADLRVNTANEAFYKTFKTSPDQTEGWLIYDLEDRHWDIPKLRTLLEDILPRNSYFNDFEVTFDFPRVGRGTILLNARRLLQGADKLPLILLAIENVTERQRADINTARLAAIVNSSDDAIIGKDLKGVITSWNKSAERLFGYTAHEAIGQPVVMLIPPDRLDEEVEILARLKRGERVDHFETLRVRKDGSRLNISLTVSPIMDTTGQVVGASKIARDITGRMQMEAALRQAQTQLADRANQLEKTVAERTVELTAANTQLEAFVYSIAHDLRAPLRAMEGFAVMLVQEVGLTLSETGKDYANRIKRAARFMDSLLMDLLTFSGTAHQRIELASVNLETVVQTTLVRLETEIQEKNARVENSGPWPAVLAHESTLGQVLFNLMSNALKFVAPGVAPVLRVRVDEWAAVAPLPPGSEDKHLSGSWVRVWVEDNGIGIAPEHQGQIFRLFTRLDGNQYPGTGLGLSIVQKAVERMGGRVGVESTPGQGSRFWFELRKA